MKSKKQPNKDQNETYTGINIQYPISELILSGKKTIETRLYQIPKSYVGQKLIIVETPGKSGQFKARLVGFIIFGPSFEYETKKAFYKDANKHCVTQGSPWQWIEGIKKWGWPIVRVEPFKKAIPAPLKKGIKFTKNIKLTKA